MKNLLTCLAFVSIFLPAIHGQQKPASSTTDPFIVEALSMIRGDSLLAYMQALQDFETRFMIAPNRREVATWIMEKFLSFGVPEVRLDSFLCNTTGFGFDTITWQYNVEAKIPGGDHADQEILTMGHYDSFVSSWSGDPMISAPGANDNASGTAAALESARIIMEMDYQPEKTLVFLATAAEELMYAGFSGAKHYAQQAYNDERNLAMIINNDMIAWNDGTGTVNIKIHENSPHINQLALHIIENYTSLDYIYGNLWTFADLEPFVELGYHGIYFMENFSNQFYPWYHTIDDVVDHLDTAYHAEITKISLGSILHLDIHGFIHLPGDANCDGAINLFDIVAMISHITGEEPIVVCFNNADVNQDGIINVNDVVLTLNMILGGGFECGSSTLTDIDANIYGTVLVGNQCWMKENLKTTRYRNGVPIENPTANADWVNNTTGAYAWYNNDLTWKDSYGALYNWHAVNNGNGLCPEGWSVPTDADFTVLTDYLGGLSVAGGKMKSTRTHPNPHPRWNSPNVGAGNESGWSAFPGGIRIINGNFLTMGITGYWWTATGISPANAWFRSISNSSSSVNRSDNNKINGYSVRCVKE